MKTFLDQSTIIALHASVDSFFDGSMRVFKPGCGEAVRLKVVQAKEQAVTGWKLRTGAS